MSLPTLFVPPNLTTCSVARFALVPYDNGTGALSTGPYTIVIVPTPGTPLEAISDITAANALETIPNVNVRTVNAESGAIVNGNAGAVNVDWRVDVPAGVALSFGVLDALGQQVDVEVNQGNIGNARMIGAGSDQSCIGQNPNANQEQFRTLLLMASSLSAAGSTIALPSTPLVPGTSATLPFLPSSPAHHSSNNLSSGAISGIIVACILFFLALASMITFLVMRRKKAKSAEGQLAKDVESQHSVEVVQLPKNGKEGYAVGGENEKEGEARGDEKVWDDAASERTIVA